MCSYWLSSLSQVNRWITYLWRVRSGLQSWRYSFSFTVVHLSSCSFSTYREKGNNIWESFIIMLPFVRFLDLFVWVFFPASLFTQHSFHSFALRLSIQFFFLFEVPLQRATVSCCYPSPTAIPIIFEFLISSLATSSYCLSFSHSLLKGFGFIN